MNWVPVVEDFGSREAWLDARASFLGGSETPVLFNAGYSSQSLYALWYGKAVGRVEQGDSPLYMRVGSLVQPVILQLAAEEEGFEVEPAAEFAVYRHAEFPYVAVTLDGWVRDGEGAGPLLDGLLPRPGTVPLEIKNIMHKVHEWDDGDVPVKYALQCHQQMLATNSPACYLIGLIRNQGLEVRRMERDPEMDAILLDRIRLFWDSVERKEPPAIDGMEATQALLCRLHPDDNGEVVTVGPAFDAMYDRRDELNHQIAALIEEKERVENRFRAAIGDASYADLPSGRRVEWKTVERRGHTVPPSAYRQLYWR